MKNLNLLDNSNINVKIMKKLKQSCALQYEREKTALKYYLIGKNYSSCIKALGFVEQIEFKMPAERRYRKDGVTPSLHHQIRISMAVMLLRDLPPEIEERCISLALLHDVQEDHNISKSEISEKFGDKVADDCWVLTKKFAGEHKNKESYISDISQRVCPSIVKGLDRNDNLEHMVNVFSLDKMDQYSTEAESIFLGMLKTSSKLFPEYIHVYNSIIQQMKRNIKNTRSIISITNSQQSIIEHEIINANKLKIEKLSKEKLEQEIHKLKIELTLNNDFISKNMKSLNKIAYIKVSESLCDLINSNKVSIDVGENILSNVSLALGFSTLDLMTFKDDKFSEGTSIG